MLELSKATVAVGIVAPCSPAHATVVSFELPASTMMAAAGREIPVGTICAPAARDLVGATWEAARERSRRN